MRRDTGLSPLKRATLRYRLRRIVHQPLFGTIRVPRDGRVDPALLPEEEFPVRCPKCGYLLRGLPDGPCPECGIPFERTRLLFRQYVLEFGIGTLWKRTKLGRVIRRLWWVGILGPLVIHGAMYVAALAVGEKPPSLDHVMLAVRVVMLLFWVVVLCAFFVAIILFVQIARNVKKRRQVLTALIREEEEN